MNNNKSSPEGEPTHSRQPKSRVYRLLKRTLLFGLVAVVALLATGYLYERSELKRTAAEVTPPGELVDIGGRNLHVHIQGEGSPTVIFDAGLGGGSLDWTLVAPEIAEVTRVVSFDRAGLWWSDAVPKPQTARDVVEDLRSALDKKGIEGPFVLVGHSMGGEHARLFQYLHPDDVAGLVLIDAAHESGFTRLPENVQGKEDEAVFVMGVSKHLATFGITRLLLNMQGNSEFGPPVHLLPDDAKDTWMALAPRRSQFVACLNELEAFDENCKQLREAAIPLGELPLTVLTSGKASLGFGQDFVDAWMVLQGELAALSSNSRHRVVEDSSHYINMERPDVVIEEVLRTVKELRLSQSKQMENETR